MNDATTFQQQILQLMGDKCLPIAQIARELGLEHRQVAFAAAELVEKGYLQRRKRGCFELSTLGRSAKQNGVSITKGRACAAPRCSGVPNQNTLRQRAWNVMRMAQKFSVPDLLTVATTGTEKSAASNLQRYCRALCRAGVLVQLRQKQPGDAPSSPGSFRFMLVNNLGPLAPSYRRERHALWDYNSEKEIPFG